MSYVGIILTFVFVNNIVLSQFLGLCPFLRVSRNLDSSLSLGFATSAVAAIAALAAWMIQHWVLAPLGIGFLQIVVFVLVSAGTALGVDAMARLVSRPLHRAIGAFLPTVTANCAVFGVVLITVRGGYGILESFVGGAAAGAGALLAMVLLSGIRRQLESEWVPKPFQGMPITLISAGLMALAFMAFDQVFLHNIVGKGL